MWKTKENMMLAVIKNNSKQNHHTEQQTNWLIEQVEILQNKLDRQQRHEDFLLEELKKLGWFDNLF